MPKQVPLACDFDPAKQVFPCILMPKLDGVRGYVEESGLYGRSGEQFPNRFTTWNFSRYELNGADGEMVAENIAHPDLCSLTSSALSTHDGTPFVQLWVFDWADDYSEKLPYGERIAYATAKVEALRNSDPFYYNNLRAVPYTVVNSMEELVRQDKAYLAMGFEGTIVRSVTGKYKRGRCTAKEGHYMRIKPWADTEILIDEIEEGKENGNVQERDALGKAKRSTHKANMIPNGMVGAVWGTLLADTPISKTKTLPKGTRVKAAAGKMSHEFRKAAFEDQALLLGQIGKIQHFPHGTKDTIRFGTFQSLRMPQDM